MVVQSQPQGRESTTMLTMSCTRREVPVSGGEGAAGLRGQHPAFPEGGDGGEAVWGLVRGAQERPGGAVARLPGP